MAVMHMLCVGMSAFNARATILRTSTREVAMASTTQGWGRKVGVEGAGLGEDLGREMNAE